MPKNRIPIEDFLTNLPLFGGLSRDAIARVAGHTTEIDAPRGTVVFRRGEACIGLHVVVYGQVKLALQTLQGEEKIVELMGRGQSFGESALFLEWPYMFTAETLSDSKLLHVAKCVVFSEVERDPKFARLVISGLSRRLNTMICEVESYTLRSGTQRVIGYLLKRLPPGCVNGDAQVTFPAKKGVIASQLNLTHEHFSRILHDLSSEGMIEVHGPLVHILDAERMRANAG
ncbi:MAG TPA: Crp/Fnr family transcriptional regulator [Burkholderiales bacterium]|jgi:cAMP-binding proteins - catabolite gene activator and regulatory subunit of cAMP-dependent protein kinases